MQTKGKQKIIPLTQRTVTMEADMDIKGVKNKPNRSYFLSHFLGTTGWDHSWGYPS